MRLEGLELRNFGWFRHAVVDLTHVRSGVILGPNGSGKSTGFVDGPLAAAFGRCRGSIDELMFPGADDMMLVVTFSHNGQRYRVIRKRSLKTAKGKSDLELQMECPVVDEGQMVEGWTSISGARLADTQQKIIDLLGADYELFVSTCFFVQGEANHFSKASPAERKTILAQVLRLDQYALLKKAALDAGRKLAIRIDEREKQWAPLQLVWLTLVELKKQTEQLTAESQQVASDLAVADRDRQESLGEQGRIRAQVEQMAKVADRLTEEEGHLQTQIALQAGIDVRQQQLEAVLNRESLIPEAEMIAAKIVELEGTRRTALEVQATLRARLETFAGLSVQVSALETKIADVQARRTPLTERRARLDQILADADRIREMAAKEAKTRAALDLETGRERELQATITSLTEELTRRQAGHARGAEIERDLERRRRDLDEAVRLYNDETGRILSVLDAAQRELEEAVRSYEQETVRLKAMIEVDERAVALLGQVPCDAGFQRRCQFTVQAVDAAERLKASKPSLASRPTAVPEIQKVAAADVLTRYAKIKEEYDNRYVERNDIITETASEQLNLVQASESDLRAWNAQDWAGLVAETQSALSWNRILLTAVVAERTRLETDLKSQATYSSMLAELEKATDEGQRLDQDLAALSGDEQALMADLSELTRRQVQKPAVEEGLRTETASISALDQRLTDLRAAHSECQALNREGEVIRRRRAELDQAIATLRAQQAERGRLEQRLSNLGQTLTALATRQTTLQTRDQELRRQLGQLAQQIQQAEEADRQAGDLKKAIEADRQDLADYSLLAEVYTQIPIFVMEAAIPMLQHEANTILEKISKTNMRVRLDTQKALKTGGISETLDIVVRDFRGERRYEIYSGAEKFMVDLAIRIGLSKLLANRAGCKLETLIIDEGFGALDTDNLVQVRECLSALSEEFPLMLVITHVEALKHTFPSQIVVRTNGNGSEIEVMA